MAEVSLVKLSSNECHWTLLRVGQHWFGLQYLNQCLLRSKSPYGVTMPRWVNTLRPRQNGRHFADDRFKCIFLKENVWIPVEISLKFVPKGSINNNPALFQIMAWRRPGDKPLSETMMISSLTHICVTRPQWVKLSERGMAQSVLSAP